MALVDDRKILICLSRGKSWGRGKNRSRKTGLKNWKKFNSKRRYCGRKRIREYLLLTNNCRLLKLVFSSSKARWSSCSPIKLLSKTSSKAKPRCTWRFLVRRKALRSLNHLLWNPIDWPKVPFATSRKSQSSRLKRTMNIWDSPTNSAVITKVKSWMDR